MFNSNIGNDINADYPVENLDVFLAGINIQFPVQLELGDIFIVTWCMFLILFVILVDYLKIYALVANLIKIVHK